MLTVVSGAFGWLVMRQLNTHGADFVVLTMFFGMVFAFGVALLNWISDRQFGFRFLSKLAQQVTFVMVPPLFLIFLVLGNDLHRTCNPDRGRRNGGDRSARPRLDQAKADLGPYPASDRSNRQALGIRGVHSDRRARIFAVLFMASTATAGSREC